VGGDIHKKIPDKSGILNLFLLKKQDYYFFLAAFLAAFLGAAFLAAFLGAAFLAAFLGAAFFAVFFAMLVIVLTIE
jgi:hypothetical protein